MHMYMYAGPTTVTTVHAHAHAHAHAHVHVHVGPTTVTTVEDVRFCSVGKPFDGATIKIENPDEDNQGEVWHPMYHVTYTCDM